MVYGSTDTYPGESLERLSADERAELLELADDVEAFEDTAHLYGYTPDRPWVKPDHAPECPCWQCLPHVVHERPELDEHGAFRYPCGRLVATNNAIQRADFAAGASHGHHYGYDRHITCPACERKP